MSSQKNSVAAKPPESSFMDDWERLCGAMADGFFKTAGQALAAQNDKGETSCVRDQDR